MSKLILKVAIDRTPYTEALFDGSVSSERISFEFVPVKPITRAFRRMARNLEFDACEMALATLALAHRYDIPVRGIPVVLLREYPLARLVCLRDGPITSPQALKGRRIAVRSYSQTTAVWVRGLMASEYGVKADEVTWMVQEDSHVSQFGPMPNEQPLAPGIELYDAMAQGTVDAAVTLHLGSHPNVRSVIPDGEQLTKDWLKRRDAEAINHLLVVKSELLDQHDWLAAELKSLFDRARCKAGDIDPAPFSARGANLLLEFCAIQGLTSQAYDSKDLICTV